MIYKINFKKKKCFYFDGGFFYVRKRIWKKKVNKGGFFFNVICIWNLRKCCIYVGDLIFDIEVFKNVGVVFMNGYL